MPWIDVCVVKVRYAFFSGNKALPVDHPEINKLVEDGNAYQPDPEVLVEMPDLTEQLNNLTLLSYLTDIDEGHGGAIAITLNNIRLFTIAELEFQNVLIKNNEASVGGMNAKRLSNLTAVYF